MGAGSRLQIWKGRLRSGARAVRSPRRFESWLVLCGVTLCALVSAFLSGWQEPRAGRTQALSVGKAREAATAEEMTWYLNEAGVAVTELVAAGVDPDRALRMEARAREYISANIHLLRRYRSEGQFAESESLLLASAIRPHAESAAARVVERRERHSLISGIRHAALAGDAKRPARDDKFPSIGSTFSPPELATMDPTQAGAPDPISLPNFAERGLAGAGVMKTSSP